MFRNCFTLTVLILSVLLGSCAKAGDSSSVRKPISEDSVNLSARTFLEDFAAQDETVKRAARLYLLGVLDTTEGKSWCGFKLLKTTSLHDFIYSSMKKLPSESLGHRASEVIEALLHNTFPCKGLQ